MTRLSNPKLTPHLILGVPGAQGVGQQHGLEDAHGAPLAPLALVILVILVTLAGASGADPPVCCPTPRIKCMSVKDPSKG